MGWRDLRHRPECGIDGHAKLLDIGACPPIEHDPTGRRRVITGTFHHHAAEILDLQLASLTEPIGTTPAHPFWSEDRQDFITAGNLHAGETLRIFGGTTHVTSITPRASPEAVYNLEVYLDHVYHVTGDGVLVHTSATSAVCKSRRPKGYQSGDTDAHGLLSPQANRATGHTNSRADGFVQSHHGIQQEWAKKNNISGYSSTKAPAILLKSESGEVHARISAAQRARRRKPGGYDTDIRTEFDISYRELIDSGLSKREAQRVMKQNYEYFDSLGAFND